MLHRLILKVTKFQLHPPNRLSTVIKNILGPSCPPMSNGVKMTSWSVKLVFEIRISVFLKACSHDPILSLALFQLIEKLINFFEFAIE